MEAQVKQYLDTEVCAECKGKCCKTLSGAALPDDILRNYPGLELEDAVQSALESGDWVIDCWEGDPRGDIDYDDPSYVSKGYYLRPRCHNDNQTSIYNYSWGGSICLLMTDEGCKLGPYLRPYGCRMLEPVAGGKPCVKHADTKNEAAIAWLPHHAMLQKVAIASERRLYE
jgi:hypothetical protein